MAPQLSMTLGKGILLFPGYSKISDNKVGVPAEVKTVSFVVVLSYYECFPITGECCHVHQPHT